MPKENRQYTMADILPLLQGAEAKPGRDLLRDGQIDLKCPFCNHNGYKLNINLAKGAFICPCCGTRGRVLHLYAYWTRGSDCDVNKLIKRGEIQREIASRLLDSDFSAVALRQQESWAAISPTEDETLDDVYSAVLRYKAFALTPEHKEALMKRGLSEESIVRNGYRTFPAECKKVLPPEIWNRLVTKELIKTLDSDTRYDSLKISQVALGLAICEDMQKRGYTLDRVPGFFKIKGRWCFRIIPGLAIPVRNHDGKIVGMQVRKDFGKVRYLTLSSKGLDCGVNTGIARVHFPLANQSIPTSDSAIITEGPLKADVTAELMPTPTFIFSIPGVKTVTPLEREYEWLKEKGIQLIKNAFDMDKLTNKNVRIGAKDLNELINAKGFHVSNFYWDADCARRKFIELEAIAKESGIDLPEISGDPFSVLLQIAQILDEREVPHSILKEGGEKKHNYWDSATKGIDDYLNMLRIGGM